MSPAVCRCGRLEAAVTNRKPGSTHSKGNGPVLPPKEYNRDIAGKVCEYIMDGYSLRKIEATEGMPRRLVILKWLRENPDFRTQYARAREEQADVLADEILDIADQRLDDPQRSRLMIDSRKWYAGKLRPKKYGDKLQQELTGAEGGPIVSAVSVSLTPDEAYRKMLNGEE